MHHRYISRRARLRQSKACRKLAHLLVSREPLRGTALRAAFGRAAPCHSQIASHRGIANCARPEAARHFVYTGLRPGAGLRLRRSAHRALRARRAAAPGNGDGDRESVGGRIRRIVFPVLVRIAFWGISEHGTKRYGDREYAGSPYNDLCNEILEHAFRISDANIAILPLLSKSCPI